MALAARRRRRRRIVVLTYCHREEIFARCPVNFDVSGAHEVFVSGQSQVPLLLALELDEGFAISAPLSAQTQSDSASAASFISN